MWERIFNISWGYVGRFRPVVLLVLCLLAYMSAVRFSELYEPKPLEPLVRVDTSDDGGASLEDEVGNLLVVSVTGAINKPGVYRFEKDAHIVIKDLVDKAGGFTDKADHLYISREINLAAKLQDGQQIYIPSSQEQKLLAFVEQNSSNTQADSGSDTSTAQGKVNINTASSDELETLPGVGPATAEKIIAGRPFTAIDDIKNVSGIGDATFNKLKDLISV